MKLLKPAEISAKKTSAFFGVFRRICLSRLRRVRAAVRRRRRRARALHRARRPADRPPARLRALDRVGRRDGALGLRAAALSRPARPRARLRARRVATACICASRDVATSSSPMLSESSSVSCSPKSATGRACRRRATPRAFARSGRGRGRTGRSRAAGCCGASPGVCLTLLRQHENKAKRRPAVCRVRWGVGWRERAGRCWVCGARQGPGRP